MPQITPRPWRIASELIEQPSWGGRYILEMKGLDDHPNWIGKRVGQSYEFSSAIRLINPATNELTHLGDLIALAPEELLGLSILAKFGSHISLLIKLTQARGNSFQVHVREDDELSFWKSKPEAWFYLAPGLYTLGLNRDKNFADYAACLTEIDGEMKRLNLLIEAGHMSVEQGRSDARKYIQSRKPYQYVNIVIANTDDIVDLTKGGIHHSWEEDDQRFPDGNLVYEVQADVPDELCSIRGFDKGKILDNGGLRPLQLADYLAAVQQDREHNDLTRFIHKPKILIDAADHKIESLFRTRHFILDRITLSDNAIVKQSTDLGFHHIFILDGEITIGEDTMIKGESFLIPAVVGDYQLEASSFGGVILKTYLPV